MSEIRETLERAARTAEVVWIRYHGGSQPGAVREISPIEVGGVYVSARDLAADRVKTFRLDRLEVVEDEDAGPDYEAEPPAEGAEGPESLGEFLSEATGELEDLGWHVRHSDDSISVHRIGKRGKPLSRAEVELSYYPLAEKGVRRQGRMRSTRPYRLDSVRLERARTFGSPPSAAAAFFEEARYLASEIGAGPS